MVGDKAREILHPTQGDFRDHLQQMQIKTQDIEQDSSYQDRKSRLWRQELFEAAMAAHLETIDEHGHKHSVMGLGGQAFSLVCSTGLSP